MVTQHAINAVMSLQKTGQLAKLSTSNVKNNVQTGLLRWYPYTAFLKIHNFTYQFIAPPPYIYSCTSDAFSASRRNVTEVFCHTGLLTFHQVTQQQHHSNVKM